LKAAVFYGSRDLRIEEISRPDSPKAGELLVKVSRAAICGTDSSEWDHGPILSRPPVVLGHEFTGSVVEIGTGVDDFAVGDRIVSGAGISCGECEWCAAGRTNLCATYYTLGLNVNGGLAEYVLAPARICRKVPDSVDDSAAALAQPLAVAIHGLRRANVRKDAATVIIGVGGIGSFLVSGAAARGANPLIAVDVDAEKLDVARALGATHVINAVDEDVIARVLEITNGIGAHVVVEASGARNAPQQSLDLVRRGGDVLILGLHTGTRELNLLPFTLREIDLHGTLAHVCADDLPEALEVLASSQLASLVVDRVITLDHLLDEGIEVLAARQAKGKIVVDLTR